ncbi:hypothetical protein [Duganella violaceipulchra]|uniref:Uncharacterized protein n=1 Tax=Duganella violaceipulchra TaxID=2849652 RepID=A0AA41HJ19_9BURK|nr:hypothetical protein [Duganella violaceicalia]MBV6325086.1 hypothetical protein [Duganella violaceicalia]MCP2010600.1 hypothetical protein [Duganella violaceicalia]
MHTFMLTTKYPAGLLESTEFLGKENAAREAYRATTPTFEILSSYKIGSDTTIDFVQAASHAEATKGANAIAEATDTQVQLAEVSTFNAHMNKLRSQR